MRKLTTAFLIVAISSPAFTGRAMNDFFFEPENKDTFEQGNKYTIARDVKRLLKRNEDLVISLYWKDDASIIVWSFKDSVTVYDTRPIKPSRIVPLLFIGSQRLTLPFAKIGTQEDSDEK